jgi:3-deoxy-manno-octulosonate cytidylyltransferase (CMP-KDO synthetase)
MILWTYQQANAAKYIDEVVVATDDERILNCVLEAGGKAVMTSSDHQTGTDRIFEAIKGIEADIILNVQGDEPLVPPETLDELVMLMVQKPEVEMGTVAVPLDPESDDLQDPGVVKAVVADNGMALYFSRLPVPYARDERPEDAPILHHWGIYAFRRDFLAEFVKQSRSPLERCENLEQLRALEMGAGILVLKAAEAAVGVDVPEDVEKVEALIKERGLA